MKKLIRELKYLSYCELQHEYTVQLFWAVIGEVCQFNSPTEDLSKHSLRHCLWAVSYFVFYVCLCLFMCVYMRGCVLCMHACVMCVCTCHVSVCDLCGYVYMCEAMLAYHVAWKFTWNLILQFFGEWLKLKSINRMEIYYISPWRWEWNWISV